MHEDWQQIETYVSRKDGADRAFATIVERYINLVFSAAMRQVNDRAAAEEVTQAVFILLAEKAPKLKPTGSLGGWLYNAASLKAKEHLRSDLARRKREQKAHDMSSTEDSLVDDDDALDWDRVAPLLDSAMGELPEGDREAVLMRYFQNQPLRVVGESLGVSEDAARKRVSRAVDRLRGWFADRGVAFSAGALIAALPANALEAAPAHLAASTVQAVATHTAAATASASTTSILTTMASTKSIAIAAAVIGAAIPISLGYLGGEPEEPAPEVVAKASAPLRIVLPGPSESELVAEWKRLREQFGPDVGSMPELYGAVRKIDDDFRRRAFRAALIAEWAELDGDGALAFLLENDKNMVGGLYHDWLAVDPEGAIASLKAGGSQLPVQIKELIIKEHLDRIAKLSPEDLPELAVHVKKQQVWHTQVQSAFSVFARNDFDAAFEMAEGMGGNAGTEALAGVALVWGERDGQEAFEWVQAFEDQSIRDRAMQGLLVGWAKSDPLAALENLHLAPPGGNTNSTYSTSTQVVEAASRVDFDRVVDWLADNRATLQTNWNNGFEGLSRVLSNRFHEDPTGTLDYIRDSPAPGPMGGILQNILLNDGSAERDVVWDWIGQQPSSEFTTRMRDNLLRSTAWKDPDVALAWVSDLPPDSGVDASHLANSLLNAGSDRERLDGLLEQVTDPAMRQALLHADLMRPDINLDAQAWIVRLEEFPDHARADASRAITRSWSLQDPQAAIAWAQGIGVDAQRGMAFQGTLEGWAGADSWEASGFVAEMEPGEDRDNAIIGLLREIAGNDADAAWRWANAATSTEHRTWAMNFAIGRIAGTDPEQAQRMLDEAVDLPGEMIDELRQKIELQRSRRR